MCHQNMPGTLGIQRLMSKEMCSKLHRIGPNPGSNPLEGLQDTEEGFLFRQKIIIIFLQFLMKPALNSLNGIHTSERYQAQIFQVWVWFTGELHSKGLLRRNHTNFKSVSEFVRLPLSKPLEMGFIQLILDSSNLIGHLYPTSPSQHHPNNTSKNWSFTPTRIWHELRVKANSSAVYYPLRPRWPFLVNKITLLKTEI